VNSLMIHAPSGFIVFGRASPTHTFSTSTSFPSLALIFLHDLAILVGNNTADRTVTLQARLLLSSHQYFYLGNASHFSGHTPLKHTRMSTTIAGHKVPRLRCCSGSSSKGQVWPLGVTVAKGYVFLLFNLFIFDGHLFDHYTSSKNDQ